MVREKKDFEIMLIKNIKDLLDINEKIDINCEFDDIGWESIYTLKLMSIIKNEYNLNEITIKELINCKKIGDVVNLLYSKQIEN